MLQRITVSSSALLPSGSWLARRTLMWSLLAKRLFRFEDWERHSRMPRRATDAQGTLEIRSAESLEAPGESRGSVKPLSCL